MEELTLIALGPFYAAAVAATWWGLNFGWHMLRRVDESAQKTALTETLKELSAANSAGGK